MAELAGVSEATVSRVFNGIGPMKEQTRKRVLAAAETLGYTPNALAQRLVRKRSGNLGVVLPKLPHVRLFSSYYFAEILSGIGSRVGETEYDLLLLFSDPGKPQDYARLFLSRKVDALLVIGARDNPDDRRAIAELIERDLPFCLIGQRYDDLPADSVDADHESGSYVAVRHLIGQGYRKIAFINGPPEYSNSADRMAGYMRALREYGLTVDEKWLFQGNYSRTSGYELAAAMAAAMEDGVEAIFAANDRMALGVMQGLLERGFKAGVHYAIAGYDDSEAARYCDPPLTSVAVPLYGMGETAAGKLIARLKGTAGPSRFHEKLPIQLVIRSSSVMN